MGVEEAITQVIARAEVFGSTFDAGASALENMHEFVEVDLTGVAPGSLEEGAVGGAEVYTFLGGLSGEEAESETAGETVSAADAVFDFKVIEPAALVELAFVPEDGRPVVHQAALHLAERGADDFDVGVGLHDLLD